MAGEAPRADAASTVRPRHVAAVVAGNALEVYDFLTYAFFAAQIGRTFFPATEPGASLLASLATFGVGFLMRPLGAAVIGRVGDRRGRKPAMLITFGLMGLSMTGLALTPSYASIGLAAPALVILFRLAQGFALGGEIGPSTAFLLEAAPPHRRGVFVSLQYLSQDAAILAAGLVGFTLASLMTEAALDAWGWRVAMLLGAGIVPLGFALRRSLPDAPAPAIDAPVRTGAAVWPTTALAVVLLGGGAVATYVQNYLTTYASSTLGMSARISFLPTVSIGLFGVLMSPVGGWLSDRYGRKPVMIIPWILLLTTTLPGFWLVSETRSTVVLVVWAALMSSFLALAIASVLTWVAESLPGGVRSTTVGLVYALAVSVFGGSTQFVVAWLTKVTASPLAPGWYMSAAALLALGAMLLAPESAQWRGRPGRG